MLGEVEKFTLFENRSTNGFSNSEFFRNAGNLNVCVNGTLDGAKIKFQISYDNITWYYLINSNDQVVSQSIEGKKVEIIETVPFYIRTELLDSSPSTLIDLHIYYIDFYKDHGRLNL